MQMIRQDHENSRNCWNYQNHENSQERLQNIGDARNCWIVYLEFSFSKKDFMWNQNYLVEIEIKGWSDSVAKSDICYIVYPAISYFCLDL